MKSDDRYDPILVPLKRIKPRFPVAPTRREESEVERNRRKPKHPKRVRHYEDE